MEYEQRKLTRRQPSRYDRSGPARSASASVAGGGKYMSETAGGTLLEDIDPQLLEEWMPQYKAAASQEERSAIWSAIKHGARPQEGSDEDRRKRVDELTKEEVDRKFKSIAEEEKKRDRTSLEENIDKFVQEMKNTPKLEGESHPKDAVDKYGKAITKEVLRQKKDWREIGWGEADRREVERKLQTKLGFGEGDARLKSAIDLLVATGKKAADVSAAIDPSPDEFKLTPEEEKTLAENPRLTQEYMIASKKRSWFAKLGIKETYITRFILLDEFRDELEDEYQRTDPPNIEEVAWQVMHHFKHENWGPHGKFPILEMRLGYKTDAKGNHIEINGQKQVDPEKSKYYINQKEFVRWARERMWEIYDINNDIGDFLSAISLPKQYSSLDFNKMFPEHKKYFTSEDGDTKYWLMAQEMIVESGGLGTLNQMSVKYNQEMRDPEGLQKAIGEMFATNVLTKETFRTNMLQLLSVMPLNYEGQTPGELMDNDGIFGSAIMDMFLAYYNLSDFEELQKVVGQDSSFFTREGYLWALQTVVEDKVGESTFSKEPTIMSAETQKYFDKAFDKNGLVYTKENKDNFIKLINFFGNKINTQDAEYVTRRLLYKMVTEKYGRVLKDESGNDQTEFIYMKDPATGKIEGKKVLKYGLTSDIEGKQNDTWTLRMSWVAAKAMSRVFGAGARNDTTAQGYDGMTKMHYAEVYRDKMVNKNGDEAGNPYTIHQFKTFAMDPFNAIVTESFDWERDANGAIKLNKKGEKVPRVKPVMEVMRDIQASMAIYTSKLKLLEKDYLNTPDGPDKEVKRQELENFKKKKNENYLNKAGQLTFKARAMSNYYDDHLMRAHEIWKVTMAAGELSMEKYVRYDAVGGVHFNRAEFQKDVQHTLIHPIRYFLNTYPDVKYNQKFRMLDQAATIREHKPIYKDMTLGEAMFGHEMLNREAFWKKDKRNKPINMIDGKTGKKLKGIYEIDYDKVEANKVLVWKQWFMTKIAADLWSHRAFHSTDTRFDLNYYTNVIKAIESIPGGIMDDESGGLKGDQYSVRDQVIARRFFDKKDMKWFRKTAKVENYDLVFRAFFKDLFQPDEKEQGIGLLAALSIFTRTIIKQGA